MPFTISKKTNGAKNSVIRSPVKGYFFITPKKISSINTMNANDEVFAIIGLSFFISDIPYLKREKIKSGITNDAALLKNAVLPNHQTDSFLMPSVKLFMKRYGESILIK